MSRLRQYRERAGLTQDELASKARVSRQLIGAAEAGRNKPRVDAALAVANALGVSVEVLFSSDAGVVDVLTGDAVGESALLRSGRVGGLVVGTAVRSIDGESGDGIVVGGQYESFSRGRDGFVVAGCEPGLVVLERHLRHSGADALTVMASSGSALGALRRGTVHAALVHGPALDRSAEFAGVTRIRLASWEVGLADSDDAPAGWFDAALRGEVPVVQREKGAGVQQTFEAAVEPGVEIGGPTARTHVEAATIAVYATMPAVTIEPAASAVGAQFRSLGIHETQLWVADEWVDHDIVTEALSFITSRPYRLWLNATGGYDLTGFGSRVA